MGGLTLTLNTALQTLAEYADRDTDLFEQHLQCQHYGVCDRDRSADGKSGGSDHFRLAWHRSNHKPDYTVAGPVS